MTSREVATVLGISVRQVARLVSTGALSPSVRAPGVRGAFLFDERDVHELAKERAA